MTVDNGSTSGLAAVHLACRSLLTSESSPICIAGAANLVSLVDMDEMLEQGLVSGSGICRPFGPKRRGMQFSIFLTIAYIT